ncbi:MAG: hypothetical protein LBK13_00075 [Spirochaetales bacterium]|nr:hypothetical protein [Spirochaetales bacterium]
MKSQYKYIESKKKKALACPAFGVFVLGCGEKKNNARDADGKVIMLCGRKTIGYYTWNIDMWD